ncbi:MAG: DUF2281 domain-containing protein [Pyrinomonadaceae bacterium]
MSMQAEKLLEKIKQLPPERVAEVENFIDFVAQSERNRIAQTRTQNTTRRSALDVLESLAGERVFKNADEVDEYLREERASWDR